MTSKNRIWKIAVSSSDLRLVSILEKIFPSLAIEILDYSVSPPLVSKVSGREEALARIRAGLKKITEVEADAYLELLEKREKSREIKF